MRNNEWNHRVWWLQIAVVAAWVVAVAALWLSWSAAVVQDMPPGDSGLAVILTTSCCGMSWVVGLVPIVLIFAILRRS